jgi:hypothetical protein
MAETLMPRLKHGMKSPIASIIQPKIQLRITSLPEETRHDDKSDGIIARKAYFTYLDNGRGDGQDMRHWLDAEAQVQAATASAAGQPSNRRQL